MIKKNQYLIFSFVITIFITANISCTPPKSLYKMEGSSSLIKKINKIIEESEIDLNMSIQIISLDNNKIIYDYNSQKLLMCHYEILQSLLRIYLKCYLCHLLNDKQIANALKNNFYARFFLDHICIYINNHFLLFLRNEEGSGLEFLNLF